MELSKLPVYKLWLAKELLAALQLPPEQQQAYLQKDAQFLAQVGARNLITAQCDWSNEEYDLFGIHEFPSLDALMEYQSCLRELHWTAYMQSKTYLGWPVNTEGKVELPNLPAPLPAGSRPIYKVALFRSKPATWMEEPEKGDAINKQIYSASDKAGMVSILGAWIRPNNEEWTAFLLERYPSIDAFYEKYALMENLGWYKYVEARSYLGTAIMGVLAGL